MKWSLRRLKQIGAAAAIACCLLTSNAQDLSPGAVWRYSLTQGSQFIDDCPNCDRIPIVTPVRGTFDLRFLTADPLNTYYAIENLWFTNAGPIGPRYQVAGHGVFTIGGEIALRQSLYLEVSVYNEVTNQLIYFSTNWTSITRRWPMLQVGADQTNGTAAQQYHLDLSAAPLREIWFSSVVDFKSTIWQPPTNVFSHGDLLSTDGRIVTRNSLLRRGFVLQPPAPDIGLKDFDILSGAEIAFSIEQSVWSEGLGQMLEKGDLLSNRGRILRKNNSLLAAFDPDLTATDTPGLAAVKIVDATETRFSVQTNFFSKALNTTVSSGDLISDSGTIIRRNAQLLSQFKPVDPSTDAGLRAVYLWPGGEIWFFVEKSFGGANGITYEAGDLLSDQGYVVYRNAELLATFVPPAGATVPLDGLWVVTDTIPNSSAPSLSVPWLISNPTAAVLRWDGLGHVFQLEKSTNAAGPFFPALPIEPDTSAIDEGAPTNSARIFYRVRQW